MNLSLFIEDNSGEDLHDAADRRDEARQALLDAGEPCTCSHDPDDHWPAEGCVRRGCLCWWWAP